MPPSIPVSVPLLVIDVELVVGGLILIATKFCELTVLLFIIVPSAQSIPSLLESIVPLLLIVVFIFVP